MNGVWVLSLLYAAVLVASAQSAEAIIGRAGSMFISEEEFLERFELMPWLNRGRKAELEESKREVLYSMIAEKLLTQEALEWKMDEDSLYQVLMLEVRKLLARDRLYRDEVSSRVSVTDEEVQQGTRHALRQILVSFIYCATQSDARFVRSLLRDAGEFDRLEFDTTLMVMRDTATVVWGSGDSLIEDAAYRLRPGEVSDVLPAGEGYYILKLDQVTPNTYYASMDTGVLPERVRSVIRSRKERRRLEEYIRTTLSGATGYSVPRSFQMLEKALRSVLVRGQDSLVTLTVEGLAEVKDMCRPSLQDTFAVAGDHFWSIAEAADRLCTKGFSIQRERLGSLPRRLNDEVRTWVEQELLGQEALRRGLDRQPEVVKEIQRWGDFYLATFMKARIQGKVSITPEEISAYFHTVGDTLQAPLVQIRELQTTSVDDMKDAIEDLHRGESFEDVVVRWSSDPERSSRKGLSPFFRAFERPPIGEIASQLRVGEQYGPIRTLDGVVMFELVARKDPENQDTSYAMRLDMARTAVLKTKQKRVLDLFLAQSAEQRGFTVYQDRLSLLKVSPIPMVTFRYLGFGGRIFAVPFLEKQVDWLNVDPPSARIVP
jgi:parvulin-like peptidyl-prolyl isomerase